MKVKFTFWKIESIAPDGAETSIIDFGPSAVPSIIVEVNNAQELLAARGRYAETATASGFCGRILTYKEGRARAFPGFSVLVDEKPLVNAEVARVA